MEEKAEAREPRQVTAQGQSIARRVIANERTMCSRMLVQSRRYPFERFAENPHVVYFLPYRERRTLSAGTGHPASRPDH